MADMPDLIDIYMEHLAIPRDLLDPLTCRHLMPNAIRFPGWSHSHDWILCRALHEMDFFLDWLKRCRDVCWFLNKDSYRNHMDVFKCVCCLNLLGASEVSILWGWALQGLQSLNCGDRDPTSPPLSEKSVASRQTF